MICDSRGWAWGKHGSYDHCLQTHCLTGAHDGGGGGGDDDVCLTITK